MWAEFVASLRIDQIAYAGIVAFIVFRILTGGLYSRSAVDEIRDERDDWKRAYFDSEKANSELMRQNTALISASRTAERVISSLPAVGREDK